MERGVIMTRDGVSLIAKIIAGECKLEITRCIVGKGYHESLSALVEGLAQPVALATSSRPRVKDGTIHFTIEYRSDMNGGLAEPFLLSEFEICALDPVKGEIRLLIGSLGDQPEPVDRYGSGFISFRRYPISIIVTDNVEVVIGYAPACFMTYEDVEEYFREVALPVFLLEVKKLIAIHNVHPEAHPDIRAKDGEQDARLRRLEDMYWNDVTGNPFLITFRDLDGLIFEGVWDKANARVMF